MKKQKKGTQGRKEVTNKEEKRRTKREEMNKRRARIP